MLKRALARLLVSHQRHHEHAIESLEKKHVNLTHPFPNDSSCFYGGDASGNAFIARLAFRGPHRGPECWLDFRPAGQPAIGLPANPGPEREGFALGELAFVCELPGKRWRLSYQGPLTESGGGTVADGAVELSFHSTHPVYDYAASSDRRLVAEAIAAQKWSGSFFRQLKDLEQVHYEQFGRLTGRLACGGRTFELDLAAVRDHSFGSRDWSTWDRHYWLSGVSPDGHGFTAVAIRYDFCGPLYAGFTTTPDGSSDAIVACTRLEDLSATATQPWPERGTLQIETRSGKRHRLDFHRQGVFPYLMDGVYLMKEGIGAYQLDGKPAWGLCEFGFKQERYAHLLT
jgi:hypothetical protein